MEIFPILPELLGASFMKCATVILYYYLRAVIRDGDKDKYLVVCD